MREISEGLGESQGPESWLIFTSTVMVGASPFGPVKDPAIGGTDSGFRCTATGM
jgi:hypothetical protein